MMDDDSTTLTNARGEQITITSADMQAWLSGHMDAGLVDRLARFDEGCIGWTVHGTESSG